MTAWRCVLCEATLQGTLVRRSRIDRSLCTWCEQELARQGVERCRRCSARCTPAAMRIGKPRWCRACDSAARSQRYHQRRAEIRDHRRAARLADHAATLERERAYREFEKPRRLARNRASYQRHREARLAANRAYYAAHAEELRAKKRAAYRQDREAHIERQRQAYQRRKLRLWRGETGSDDA